jgi:hypothetical protein
MRRPAAALLLGVTPAIAASCIVLSISGVPRGVWVVQAMSIVLMLVVAGGVMVLPRRHGAPSAESSLLLAAVGVSAAALALVLAIGRTSIRGDLRLQVVAAYYAVLFVCSLRDLTPAPIIGFGAGPIIGYGMMTGVATLLDGMEERLL